MPEQMVVAEEVQAARAEQLERVEDQPVLDFELVRDTLEQQVDQLSRSFKVKHRRLLRWADKRGYSFDFLVQSGAKVAVTGGLMASLLLSTPQAIAGLPSQPHEQQQQQQLEAAITARKKYQMTVQATQQRHQAEQQQLVSGLQQLAQQPDRFADTTTSAAAAQMVGQLTGVPAVDTLEGYRLNTNIGRIGWEQHLKRYPGEAMTGHFASAADRQAYESSGFAPGLGAYGYFAPSAAAMTEEAAAREQYYVALQTFASPNWQHNVQATYNWFKFRKVVVYNPATNKAVVADVADAGPALATGKSFGGSPEVMMALEAHDGRGTPPVMVFFVDDPGNQIPLGPVSYQLAQTDGL